MVKMFLKSSLCKLPLVVPPPIGTYLVVSAMKVVFVWNEMMKMRDRRDLKTKIENEVVVVMYDYEYDAVILAHEMGVKVKKKRTKNVLGGVGMFG